MCGPKNTKSTLKIECERLYFFQTQSGSGNIYKNNVNCTVNFKLGKTCGEMSFVCHKSSINNKDKKKCTKGDKMKVFANFIQPFKEPFVNLTKLAKAKT